MFARALVVLWGPRQSNMVDGKHPSSWWMANKKFILGEQSLFSVEIVFSFSSSSSSQDMLLWGNTVSIFNFPKQWTVLHRQGQDSTAASTHINWRDKWHPSIPFTKWWKSKKQQRMAFPSFLIQSKLPKYTYKVWINTIRYSCVSFFYSPFCLLCLYVRIWYLCYLGNNPHVQISLLLPVFAHHIRGRKCVTVMAVVALLPLFTRPCLLSAI